MKTISCYVVDDEFSAIDLLTKFIERTPGLTLSGASENPLEALPVILSSMPDITFVDIQMQQISGLDFSTMIRESTAIIFTTAHSQYALRAFEVKATDYLLKPFAYERFLDAVTRVRKSCELAASQKQFLQEPYFFVKSEMKGKIVRINTQEINYIEAAQNYLIIYLDDSRHITYLTMKEMEEALDPGQFIRVHKSYIVNTRKISSVENGAVILKNRSAVMIGAKYKDQFLKQLSTKVLVSKRN